MVNLLVIVKKAATFGYKKYGIPGAIASSLIVLGGYMYLKQLLKGSGSDDESGDSDAEN